jgi:hypothetical protein
LKLTNGGLSTHFNRCLPFPNRRVDAAVGHLDQFGNSLPKWRSVSKAHL